MTTTKLQRVQVKNKSIQVKLQCYTHRQTVLKFEFLSLFPLEFGSFVLTSGTRL